MHEDPYCIITVKLWRKFKCPLIQSGEIMNIFFMDYVTTVKDQYSYVAPWEMFDGERSRMYHMTMSKKS